MNFSWNVRDSITPKLRRDLARMRNPRPVAAAMGKALANEHVKIFREFDSSKPNAQGWPRKHFWNRRVAQKVALTQVTDTTATMTIASPELIHKIKGGTVTPKRGSTLAIPANAEASRMGPRASGKDYTFLLLAQGNLVGALLNVMSQSISFGKKGVRRGKEKGGEVMYWLVRKVTHKPHPECDPGRNSQLSKRVGSAIGKAAASAIERHLK